MPFFRRKATRRTLLAAFGTAAIASQWPSADASTSGGAGLDAPAKKDIAMRLVSSAENSSLDWEAQYAYIEDIGDGRGYTGGIIGFCSGTGDMLALVELYTERAPGNVLMRLSARAARRQRHCLARRVGPRLPLRLAEGRAHVRRVPQGAARRAGPRLLRPGRGARQEGRGGHTRAVRLLRRDGDARPGHGPLCFGGIRTRARKHAATPTDGGDETTYLNAFLDARVRAMRQEEAHSDVTRVETAQRVFLKKGNLDLDTPLKWQVYGDSYEIG